MPACLTVARKEIRDHLRDLRSLSSTALYALMGPAVVGLVSLSGVGSTTVRSTLLLSMASVFALVSAFAGGMNVAVDSTAGERERRSLVPLLLNPVSRFDLVIGKWMAASVFGLGSVGLTVTAFLPVLISGTSQSLHELAARLSVWVWLGLAPLAILGAAVHLAIAANSRTAKEANSWLSMVIFIPMLVGMFLVFFPEWTRGWWIVAPIAGQHALVARGIAGEPASFLEAAILATVTVGAAIPALLTARAALNRPDVTVG